MNKTISRVLLIIILLSLTLQFTILTERASAIAPSITTLEATNINSTSATLNGFLSNNFSKETDVWFEYGTSPSFGSNTPLSFSFSTWISNYSVEGDGVLLGTEEGMVDSSWSTFGGTCALNTPDVKFIYMNATYNVTHDTYNLTQYSSSTILAIKNNLIREIGSSSFARIWVYYYSWEDGTHQLAYTRYAISPIDSIVNTTANLPSNATNDDNQIQITTVLRVESKIDNRNAYAFLLACQIQKTFKYMTSNSQFGYTLNDITPSTTKYYYRAVASNADGTTYGETYTFGGDNATSSYPLNSTSIETTSCTLRGYLNSTLDSTTNCGFWVSNQTNDFGSLLYNYYGYNSSSTLWEKPSNMTDGSTSTYSYIPKDTTTRNQTLTLNNCSNTTGCDIGTIRKVEVRFYRYADIPITSLEKWGGNINITPIFDGTEGGTYSIIPSSTAKWSNWTDITYDTNAPIWSWNDIQTLNLNMSGFISSDVADTGAFVSKVDIRVSGNASTFTASGTYDTGNTFTTTGNNFVPAEYYYARTWTNSEYEFNVSGNASYFLTRPNSTTNFKSSNVTVSGMDLSWKNSSLSDGINTHSVLIHYSTTSPSVTPTPDNWGTEIANVSDHDNITVSGLPEETTVYFVAWTYIEDSGSPTLGIFSSSYSIASGTTQGGTYNIHVKYENETDGTLFGVNLSSEFGPHKCIIHYENQTDYVIFSNYGDVETTVDGFFNYNTSGNFTIDTNYSIKYIEFQWNSTTNRSLRCSRIQVLYPQERNITFYIRTDLPVYGESSAYPNHSLMKYRYAFLDETGKFRYPNNPYMKLFKYSSNGTLMMIHSEYFDAGGYVYPWLIYNEKYFMGVYCDVLSIERIGLASTGETLEVDARIPFVGNIFYNFFDLINLDVGWYDSGFFVDYFDTTSSTIQVTLHVYGFRNDTLLHTEVAYDDSHNFTYTTAEGCNLSNAYKWQVITVLSGTGPDKTYNGTYFAGGESSGIVILPGVPIIIDASDLDDFIEIMVGKTPFFDPGNPGAYVRWTHVLLFGLAFIILVTFGKLNAFLGMMSTSMVLILGGAVIGQMGWIILVSIFILCLSVIGLIGGVEKR